MVVVEEVDMKADVVVGEEVEGSVVDVGVAGMGGEEEGVVAMLLLLLREKECLLRSAE